MTQEALFDQIPLMQVLPSPHRGCDREPSDEIFRSISLLAHAMRNQHASWSVEYCIFDGFLLSAGCVRSSKRLMAYEKFRDVNLVSSISLDLSIKVLPQGCTIL